MNRKYNTALFQSASHTPDEQRHPAPRLDPPCARPSRQAADANPESFRGRLKALKKSMEEKSRAFLTKLSKVCAKP